jgi:hypothetical protein
MDTLVNFTGTIANLSAPYILNGIKVQYIVIAVKTSIYKTNYYTVYIYGIEAISNFWVGYNDKNPGQVDITAKLSGKINKQGNNSLTLTLKNRVWKHS